MIISCKCVAAQTFTKNHKIEFEIDLTHLPTAQRMLLSSGNYQWIQVGSFERMVGMRREVIRKLISTGDLLSIEIPFDPRTKLGFGRRAFVAVQTYPCMTCCPDHYEVKWGSTGSESENEF
jgi:hypothetical protein